MTAPSESPQQLAATPFREALAASGLVEAIALRRAEAAVAPERFPTLEAQDRRLAERLVESGDINWWQVEQLRLGRTKFKLGPYWIVDSIARGGMGHVFKCEHELLGRVEAIKVLPKHKSNAETIGSFRQEVRAQAALDHPNLVRVSYADRDGETYYLVTEYVPGIDLRRLIHRSGPLEQPVAAYVLSKVCEAIDHAHRRGLVHRDIKPGNVLLTPVGKVKVTDLGLAWTMEGVDDWATHPAEGKVVGTSDYLAPEAIREPGRILPASDFYGLGCTLYYAVTGKVPFPGGSHADKMRRHLGEAPIEAGLLVPDLAPDLAELIRALMSKRAEDRPDEMTDVIGRLRALFDDDAPERLGTVVTDTLARRYCEEEETNGWSFSSADELPETVGSDLEAADPFDAAEPATEAGRTAAPRLIAWGALGLAGAIALLAIGRVLFS